MFQSALAHACENQGGAVRRDVALLCVTSCSHPHRKQGGVILRQCTRGIKFARACSFGHGIEVSENRGRWKWERAKKNPRYTPCGFGIGTTPPRMEDCSQCTPRVSTYTLSQANVQLGREGWSAGRRRCRAKGVPARRIRWSKAPPSASAEGARRPAPSGLPERPPPASPASSCERGRREGRGIRQASGVSRASALIHCCTALSCWRRRGPLREWEINYSRARTCGRCIS